MRNFIRRYPLYTYAFLACVLFKGVAYWWLSWILHPSDPVSVWAMYRAGDIDCYPFIRALSQGQIHEFSLYDLHGQGLWSFPIMCLLPHAIAFRLLGAWGFIAVDIAVNVVFYFSLVAFLRRLQLSLFAASAASLMLVSRVADVLFSLINAPMKIWESRIPRPFITDLFFVWSLWTLFAVWDSKRSKRPLLAWSVAGISAGLLLQGDMYSAQLIVYAVAIQIPFLFTFKKDSRKTVAKGLCLFALFAALASLPFFLQRLAEHPDIPLRYGVFPVDRFAPLFFHGQHYAVLMLTLYTVMLLAAFRFYDIRASAPTKSVAVAFFYFMCVVAYLSLSISGALFGKAVQVGHFEFIFARIMTYTIFIYSLFYFDLFATWISLESGEKRKAWLKKMQPIAVVPFLVAAALATSAYAYKYASNSLHMRNDFKEFDRLSSYRADFTALTRELSRPKYGDAQVLATFDPMFYSWWMTFKGGWSYLANPFSSTASNEIVETRLVKLCSTLGMTDEDFRKFVLRPYVTVFWWSCNKFQVSKAYSYRPLEEYDANVRESIRLTSVLNDWNIAVPRSEEERIVEKFRTTPKPAERLDRGPDLIVLTNDESLRHFSPTLNGFSLTYMNPSFRVWKKSS